uniref:Uncharacterized protein n=1 Tax=Rhizophora mucronata TaxID=61149 RepID=A0A2P2J5J5_RHIMU
MVTITATTPPNQLPTHGSSLQRLTTSWNLFSPQSPLEIWPEFHTLLPREMKSLGWKRNPTTIAETFLREFTKIFSKKKAAAAAAGTAPADWVVRTSG